MKKAIRTKKTAGTKKRRKDPEWEAVRGDSGAESDLLLKRARKEASRLNAKIRKLQKELRTEKAKDGVTRLIEEDTIICPVSPHQQYMEDHPDEMEKYAGQTVAIAGARGVVGHGASYSEARNMVIANNVALSEVCFDHVPETQEMLRARWEKQEADKAALADKLGAISELDAALAAYLSVDDYGDTRPENTLALRNLLVRLDFKKCLAHYGFENPFRIFDRNYNQEARCTRIGCGHEYNRHFDWGMGYHPNCKYCSCEGFVPEGVASTPVQRFDLSDETSSQELMSYVSPQVQPSPEERAELEHAQKHERESDDSAE